MREYYRKLLPYESFSESENDGYVIYRKTGKEVYIGKHDPAHEILYDKKYKCFVAYCETFLGVHITKCFTLDDESGTIHELAYNCMPDVYGPIPKHIGVTGLVMFDRDKGLDPDMDQTSYDEVKQKIISQLTSEKEMILESLRGQVQVVIDSYNELAPYLEVLKKEVIDIK